MFSFNNSIPISFFEKHLNMINWADISYNNFEIYFKNIEREGYKNIMNNVFEEIKTFLYSLPSNQHSMIPKGGKGYLEVLGKYE